MLGCANNWANNKRLNSPFSCHGSIFTGPKTPEKESTFEEALHGDEELEHNLPAPLQQLGIHQEALRSLENTINPTATRSFDGVSTGDENEGFSRSSVELRTGVTKPHPASLSHGSRTSKSRPYAMCTLMPERMTSQAFKKSGAMAVQSQEQLLEEAVKRKEENSDIQTTFFVNFVPEGLTGNALSKLNEVVDNVKLWQRWASSLAVVNTQGKINRGELSNGTDGRSQAKQSAIQRGTERTVAFKLTV